MNELPKLPRMAAIHDISGFGKCSLTVALPVVSATGVECCCIPTALLSTHTGGFEGWSFRDLSDDILPIAEHWNKLGIRFDAIYSGYLASETQGELLQKTIELLSDESTLVIIDPAMADNGKYYSNLDERMTACFRRLISNADIITPNITEACFLTDTEYKEQFSREELYAMLNRLSDFGPDIVAITGASLEKGRIGVIAKDRCSGTVCEYMSEAREGTFHGSGDVFASAFSALLVRGARLSDALSLAEDFVSECIERTDRRGVWRRYGLDFEGALPQYILKVNELLNLRGE